MSKSVIGPGAALGGADGPWRWEVGRGPAGLERFAEDWNDLAHRGTLSPTADAIWLRAFSQSFGPSDERLVLHALYCGNRLACLIPLERTGRLSPTWSVIANDDHTPYMTFPIDETRPEVGARVIEHLLHSADVVELNYLHENGPICTSLVEAARRCRRSVVMDDANGDALIDLSGSWNELRGSLSKNLQADTPRKQRGLERMGKLEFATLTDDVGLTMLDECFELEAVGWKGASGSPIKAHPSTHRFYTELARSAAAAGRFALYTLRLDSKLIAFEYCLRAQGKIDMLKLSFHPALAKNSPGNVLRFMILRQEIDAGIVKSYHLGRPSEWKLRWATRVEPLVQLRIYRNGPLALARYYGGPRLRGLLKRSETLRALVRWGRRLGARGERR